MNTTQPAVVTVPCYRCRGRFTLTEPHDRCGWCGGTGKLVLPAYPTAAKPHLKFRQGRWFIYRSRAEARKGVWASRNAPTVREISRSIKEFPV